MLIILDEAYFEYAKDNPRYPDSMHYRYDNVITLRTFSKIYGLAGIRIGYGFAHEDLIANLLKVKLPFEPSTLAQAAGIGALADKEFLHRSLELNARGLRLLTDSFRGMGLAVVPSDANFVMLPLASAEEARALTEALLREGVIVRPLEAFGLPQCIRVSTGTDEDNHALRGGGKGAIMQTLTESPAEAAEGFSAAERHRLCGVLCGQRASRRPTSTASAFGMRLAAYRGPETGTRDRASWLVEQDKIRLVLTTRAGARASGRRACAPARRWRARYRAVGGRCRIGLSRDHAARRRAACASRRPCATSTAKCASPPSPLMATPSTHSWSGGIIAASSCPASCR